MQLHSPEISSGSYFDDVYAGKFIPDDEKLSCTSVEIPTGYYIIKRQFSGAD
ncbi:MAG: hypothetical protein IPN61_14375 [Bacteroidetes bacterium]|nr:hypothetical protein [Bacteroidota bacterium]